MCTPSCCGGLAPDGKAWVACRPGFFLSVRVLSRLFRRRFLEELLRVHETDKLQFFGEHAALTDAKAFKAWLTPLRKCEWVVYAVGGGLKMTQVGRFEFVDGSALLVPGMTSEAERTLARIRVEEIRPRLGPLIGSSCPR